MLWGAVTEEPGDHRDQTCPAMSAAGRGWWLKTSISVYGAGEQEFAVVDATVDRYNRVTR